MTSFFNCIQHGVCRLYMSFKPPELYSFVLMIVVLISNSSYAQIRLPDSKAHHLRLTNEPEWEEFVKSIPKPELNARFQIDEKIEHTISFVQYDVKQDWDVLLNDQKIGSLVTDGNKIRIYFQLKPSLLTVGENSLTIRCKSKVADDIVISEINLEARPVSKILTEDTVDINVMDQKTRKGIPARLTIVDRQKTLQSTGTIPADHLAIRPGFVYTASGQVSLLIPAGEYTIYAGRGFEYGVDSVAVKIIAGQREQKQLILSQEVNTDGWISSDTHIHTLTNSGHGDATDRERSLTIAGEGIELPVITEHNMIPDFKIVTKNLKLDSFFTLVTGDEATTAVGHFNIFPLKINGQVPDHRVKDWADLAKNLPGDSNTIKILNHGRDVHNGFRPFDTTHHISIAGTNVDGWQLPVNAMELLNSGALLEDPFTLIQDWFGLLNRGLFLTPVGSSDSHDVSRYLVGQARTYIRSSDTDAGKINIENAVRAFKKGHVLVSFGLLPKIIVNDRYGPGDAAIYSRVTTVDAEVLGPGWTNARQVSLYANGEKIFEENITNGNGTGIKWKGRWTLPPRKQDFFLVVIAEGDGSHRPFWPIVKPFQPVSSRWTPYTLGLSGAVWVDADGDGKISSTYDYARKLGSRFGQNYQALFKALSAYDEAVIIQAAASINESGVDLSSAEILTALSKSGNSVKKGFEKFMKALPVSKRK